MAAYLVDEDAAEYEFEGQVYKVNALSSSPLEAEILDALFRQIKVMLSWHGKVLFVRLDSRSGEYDSDNRRFSQLLKAFKRALREKFRLVRIAHLWVAETEKSKRAHYHLILLLNGDKIQSSWRINQLWMFWHKKYSLDQPYFYGPNSMMIRRNDRGSLQEAIWWGSYLSKTRGKGYLDANSKRYSVSHTQPRCSG